MSLRKLTLLVTGFVIVSAVLSSVFSFLRRPSPGAPARASEKIGRKHIEPSRRRPPSRRRQSDFVIVLIIASAAVTAAAMFVRIPAGVQLPAGLTFTLFGSG